MSENLLQTLQQLVQDVIAPDVRELKVRVSSLEKQMDVRFDAVDVRFNALDQRFDSYDQKTDARFDGVDARFNTVDSRFNALEQKTDSRFNALEQKMDAHFVALMAAIGESKAQSELTTMRLIAPPAERIAVLEAQRR